MAAAVGLSSDFRRFAGFWEFAEISTPGTPGTAGTPSPPSKVFEFCTGEHLTAGHVEIAEQVMHILGDLCGKKLF